MHFPPRAYGVVIVGFIGWGLCIWLKFKGPQGGSIFEVDFMFRGGLMYYVSKMSSHSYCTISGQFDFGGLLTAVVLSGPPAFSFSPRLLSPILVGSRD